MRKVQYQYISGDIWDTVKECCFEQADKLDCPEKTSYNYLTLTFTAIALVISAGLLAQARVCQRTQAVASYVELHYL